MVIELKKGYTIDSWYDKFTDSYITRLLDPEGNQVRDALYSGDIVGRNYDVQSIKDFFTTYMKDPNFNTEQTKVDKDEDYTDEQPNEDESSETVSDEEIQNDADDSLGESLDSELDKKAKKTKKATRKAKLPALSKMTPIMPDYESGISKFNAATADGNSGMASTTGSTGLGEAYIGRNDLIKSLKDMGFKYKFDKYSDKQLFRIYQERKAKLEKQKAEEKKKELEDAYRDNKEENKKDSYFKNDIEFESEDAAREYFGEEMNEDYRVGRKIARDRLVGHKVSKSSLSQRAKEILKDNGVLQTVTDDAIYDLDPKTAKKVSTILNNNGINTEVIERYDELYTVYLRESMSNKFYLNDMHEAWDIVEDEPKEVLNESKTNAGHGFKTLNESFHYFERKYFDEKSEDAGLQLMFESMRDKLSSEDVKKLGAFMNHAENADEVLTYMKGLLSEGKNTDDIYDPDKEWETSRNGLNMIAYPLHNAIIREANNKGVWNVEENGVNVYPGDDVIEFFYFVDGDWKHDHLRFDNIVANVIRDFGFELKNSYEEPLDDSESDTYAAMHSYLVDVSSAVTPKNESLNESLNDDWVDVSDKIQDIPPKAHVYEKHFGEFIAEYQVDDDYPEEAYVVLYKRNGDGDLLVSEECSSVEQAEDIVNNYLLNNEEI